MKDQSLIHCVPAKDNSQDIKLAISVDSWNQQ